MVDVSDKAATQRTARAEGFVAMAPETLALIEKGEAEKGDVLATARIAGIMAAKRTHELIPLCHPLAHQQGRRRLRAVLRPAGIRVAAEVKVTGPTGVEMEALTAVSVACLTIYDMLKAADKAMRIEGIRLVDKSGGRSGAWRSEPRGTLTPWRCCRWKRRSFACSTPSRRPRPSRFPSLRRAGARSPCRSRRS